MRLPSGLDLSPALLSQARHFVNALYIVVENIYGILAEFLYDSLRRGLAYTFNTA